MSEARRAPPRTVRARVTVGGARACAARSPGQDQSRRQAGGKDAASMRPRYWHVCVHAHTQLASASLLPCNTHKNAHTHPHTRIRIHTHCTRVCVIT
jgi:hypothetical protein